MRIWITEPQTLCQGEEAPVLWLCLFWWHCWHQDWGGTVPSTSTGPALAALSPDEPLSCSSSQVNAVSWEAFPS